MGVRNAIGWAALLAAVCIVPGLAQAQPRATTPLFTRLADDLWEVPGADDAANVTVLVTNEGLVLVDGRYAKENAELMQIIREHISTKPIKYVINTHSHADHTGANSLYLKMGATLISSIGTRDNIVRQARPDAPPDIAPPNLVFSGEMRMFVGGKEIVLRSYPPAHTSEDVTVFFPKDRVICTGDLGYAPDPTEEGGPHPNIDFMSGGSMQGWIDRLDTITALDGYDVVVPGHVGLTNKAELIVYRNVLEKVRDDVKAFLRDGTKTEADLRAHLVKDLHYPDPGNAIRNVHGLYLELKPPAAPSLK
jgi:glyoxylase-like metal-dependent hydrolase (beta-lactamase superfamily II)